MFTQKTLSQGLCVSMLQVTYYWNDVFYDTTLTLPWTQTSKSVLTFYSSTKWFFGAYKWIHVWGITRSTCLVKDPGFPELFPTAKSFASLRREEKTGRACQWRCTQRQFLGQTALQQDSGRWSNFTSPRSYILMRQLFGANVASLVSSPTLPLNAGLCSCHYLYLALHDSRTRSSRPANSQ